MVPCWHPVFSKHVQSCFLSAGEDAGYTEIKGEVDLVSGKCGSSTDKNEETDLDSPSDGKVIDILLLFAVILKW